VKTEISNVAIWILILLAFAAFIPLIAVIDRQSMFEIVDGLAVGGAIGAVIRWGAVCVERSMATGSDAESIGSSFSRYCIAGYRRSLPFSCSMVLAGK
jgi:hypothetical protein